MDTATLWLAWGELLNFCGNSTIWGIYLGPHLIHKKEPKYRMWCVRNGKNTYFSYCIVFTYLVLQKPETRQFWLILDRVRSDRFRIGSTFSRTKDCGVCSNWPPFCKAGRHGNKPWLSGPWCLTVVVLCLWPLYQHTWTWTSSHAGMYRNWGTNVPTCTFCFNADSSIAPKYQRFP